MPRRGKCRCGALLLFQETAQGYKTRCGKCKAVVRLRVDGPANQSKPRSRAALAAAPASAPAPAALAPALPDAPEVTPDFSVLGLRESTAPAARAEMEVYRDPPPKSSLLWWLLAAAVFL